MASGMEMTISCRDVVEKDSAVVKKCGIHLVVDEPKAIMDSEYSMDMMSAIRDRDDDNYEAGSSND